MSHENDQRRQYVYWRTLIEALGTEEQRAATQTVMKPLVADLELPALTLEPRASVKQIVRSKPELEALVRIPREDDPAESPDDALRRTVLVLKSILNVFGDVGGDDVSAEEYQRWLDDVAAFERAAGYEAGGLYGSGTSGGGPKQGDAEVGEALEEIERGEGLMAEPEIRAGLEGIEKRLIDHMKLREVLADAKLAAKLRPSMALTAQLLRDKDHLEGPALKHAKQLIKRFVDELADVLKRDVAKASRGAIDHSVPPKRTFANLDLKRTIWRNLTNWDPKSQKLYVNELHYRRRSKLENKTNLIIVVDQSGSMIPAMVNCTILASIFAGLPKVEASLIAFDTEALDLTPWVHEPFEVLLRTQLGGGNDGPVAMPFVHSHIREPRNAVVVWISDFYEVRELMGHLTQLVRSGVTLIPVGSVSTSGYFSVDPWFRAEFKKLGTPVLSGSLKTLIKELKAVLP